MVSDAEALATLHESLLIREEHARSVFEAQCEAAPALQAERKRLAVLGSVFRKAFGR